MTPEQFRAFLALWHIPSIGVAAQRSILEHYPDINEFFNLSTSALKQIGFSNETIALIKSPPWEKADETLRWAESTNHHLIFFQNDDYPRQLAETPGAPTLLFAKGDKGLLQYSQLAIVGSRNPSPSACTTAKQYSHYLSEQGLVITSGMALGIDAAAHQGVLSGGGKTIAVLGTGIDVVYPKRHKQLAFEIEERGLLLSEFPLNSRAKTHHFPQRNRIISGLSLGTFVVEAAIRSGSLITARFALEQGREVFAMPSSIHNPMAKGCHWLLKQGASLVESVDDIWQHLNQFHLNFHNNQLFTPRPLESSCHSPHNSSSLSEHQQQLLAVMGFDRISTETLQLSCNFTVEQLSVLLIELELAGLIEKVPGGFQRIR